MKKLKTAGKIKQEQLKEWILECLMEMICLMNCYWQQDKKQS